MILLGVALERVESSESVVLDRIQATTLESFLVQVVMDLLHAADSVVIP